MLPLQGNLGLKIFRLLELLSPAPFCQVSLVRCLVLVAWSVPNPCSLPGHFQNKNQNPLKVTLML